MNRRHFFQYLLGTVLALPVLNLLRKRPPPARTFWQINPEKCIQCGNCATACVKKPSAVKCVHQYASCGYCDFCSGYYHDDRARFDTAAENQRCPTGAIVRTFVEDPYFEYKINEELCIGCGKCVNGCASFGNGSLFLQVRHSLCLNCNQCQIALSCPAHAFVKVPAGQPYIFKTLPREATT